MQESSSETSFNSRTISDVDGESESKHESNSNQASSINSDTYQYSVSGSEFDSDVEILDESEIYQSDSKRDISKIIGINQPTFDESSTSIMFYVKFKNESYRNCDWITQEELCQSKSGYLAYRFLLHKPKPFSHVTFYDQIHSKFIDNNYKLYKPDDVPFDKGFITPGKVISMRTNYGKKEYFVKWVSLDISKSTWETEDIPDDLINEFTERNSNTHFAFYNARLNKKHQFEQFEESPVFKNDNKLTDYQVEGLNWLQMCWLQRKSSILADEMGLGKTIEAISILNCLTKWYTSWGPFLVVCPLSTITNWLNEFERWTNFRVVCLMGNSESRKVIKDNLIFQHDVEKDQPVRGKIIFDVLLVSYEWLIREINFIKKFNFMYTIIDEAQKLKSAQNNFYECCQKVNSYIFLLLTGTPIQNNLFEIWSLLHFIAPAKFNNYESFDQKYNDKENPETIEKLQEILRPYIFRRKKNDVNLNIPEKEETIIEVEMTQIQRTFSQLIFKDNLDILSDGSKNKLNLNNIMMELRKLFCHPFLFPHLESICYSEYKDTHKIPYSTPLTEEDEINSLILASGKTILIDKLLPKLKEGHHKVLIFSQFTSMLDILEDYLTFKHYIYERLDGSSGTTSRSTSIERFQKDEDVFIFLLSTRAGGLGINLTRADTVIIYDSDWNPQNDIQAQARCHRIGQTNKVNVYRLVTRGSYESEMFFRASKKLALDYAILDSASNEKESKSVINDRKELEMILKKGAYYTFKDDPSEIDKFCSENIDQILEHRSHTRNDVVSGGNSKFSKITFDGQAEESAMNQNNFWDNLIGAQNIIEENDKNKPFSDSGIRTRRKKKVDYSYKPQKKDELDNDEKPKPKQKTKSQKNINNQQGLPQPPFIYPFSPQIMNKQSSIQVPLIPVYSTPQPIYGANQNIPKSQSTMPLHDQSLQTVVKSNSQTSLNANIQASSIKSNSQASNPTMEPIHNSHASVPLNTQALKSTNSQSSTDLMIERLKKIVQANAKTTQPQASTSSSNAVYRIADSCKFNKDVNKQTQQNQSTNKSSDSISSDITIDQDILVNSLSTLYIHGLGAVRLFASDFINEICKSLFTVLYFRLSKTYQEYFESYFHQHIRDPNEQLMRTPYKEFKNEDFLKSLFRGNELNIMKNCYNWDTLYKVAIYISNEKLPENFQFIPEMDIYPGWSAIDDFTAITGSPFLDMLTDISSEDRLPFKKFIKNDTVLKNWVLKRIELNVREIKAIIPPTYNIYELNANKLIPKKIGNIEMFEELNYHIICQKTLNRCMQKRLLRLFYLYGIPSGDGLDKISTILKNQIKNKELIIIFAHKFIYKAIKYKPHLFELLETLPRVKSFNNLNNNDYVDIRWIKEEAIEAVASNLDLIFRVREAYKMCSKNFMLNKIIQIIPTWTEIQKYCPFWNAAYDEALFKLVVYYGFLFNSMFFRIIPTSKISEDDIAAWRESEILHLNPIIHPKAKYLERVFTFEMKEKRINKILELIDFVKEKISQTSK